MQITNSNQFGLNLLNTKVIKKVNRQEKNLNQIPAVPKPTSAYYVDISPHMLQNEYWNSDIKIAIHHNSFDNYTKAGVNNG